MFEHLFQPTALSGNITPGFQWDLLNYGRLLNNVRLQEAKLQELIAAYQQTVLNAHLETENGLVSFLKAQEQTRVQKESADAGAAAVKAIQDLWKNGLLTEYTRVAQLELNQVVLEDTLAQDEGQIALGLIQVYLGLGGGWQIRLTGCPETAVTPQGVSTTIKTTTGAATTVTPQAAPHILIIKKTASAETVVTPWAAEPSQKNVDDPSVGVLLPAISHGDGGQK